MTPEGATTTTVAVIGLGAMGSRIAGRLLHAGHQVLVWNRSPGRTGPLTARGAVAVDTPADAAARAETLITMVADPASLRAVSEGADGLAAGAHPALTVIEMSTVGPRAVARLRAALPDRVGLLDAPVLGSIGEAAAGSLVIFAGGPAAAVQEATPLLSTLGSVRYAGPLGAGAAAKLVANAALFTTLAALGEAVALARGLGLETSVAYDVLADTPLATQAERRRTVIDAGEYPPRFPVALARKDADLIGEEARAGGLDLRLTEAARTWLTDTEAAGRGGQDYTAALATILASLTDLPAIPPATP